MPLLVLNLLISLFQRGNLPDFVRFVYIQFDQPYHRLNDTAKDARNSDGTEHYFRA